MFRYLALLAACAVPVQPAFAAEATPTAADCDRHCMLSILTIYTEALIDNAASRLAVSPQLRVTSNGNGQLHSGCGKGPGS